MTQTQDPQIGRELAQAKFTDEMLDNMRALIGTELRTASAVNNEYATRLAILRFCEASVTTTRCGPTRSMRRPQRTRESSLRRRSSSPAWVRSRSDGPASAGSTAKPPSTSTNRSVSTTRSPRRWFSTGSTARPTQVTSPADGSRTTCGRSTATRTTSSPQHSSARGCGSSAPRCKRSVSPARSNFHTPGPRPSSNGSSRTSSPRRRVVPNRATGTTFRSVTTST